MNLFNNIYNGKTVLITGNTGFKGSWLAFWLLKLGANVIGYSLKPITTPNHFSILNLDYETFYSDINDFEKLSSVIKKTQPDIIFHLAAQPLVRYSYISPLETIHTNVIGTANVLEAARYTDAVKAIIIITTDKCYENNDERVSFIETDKMGGFDPYSSSKGCAELITSSFRNSFFNLDKFGKSHNKLVASARAGNVIGGGDWSEDRLIPDIIRSSINNSSCVIRNPNSTRPWQHVLEPLRGYLLLGEKLLFQDISFADAFNFGPEENNILSVKEVLNLANKKWGKISYIIEENIEQLHEANHLSLNITKAKDKLNWMPFLTNEQGISKTIDWYKYFYQEGIIYTDQNINDYEKILMLD